jgi:hypothetical protein
VAAAAAAAAVVAVLREVEDSIAEVVAEVGRAAEWSSVAAPEALLEEHMAVDIQRQVGTDCTLVAEGVEEVEQQAEERDNDQLAAERPVELAVAAVANGDQLVLRSHNSHTKRSVQASAAPVRAEAHSIAGCTVQEAPDAAAAAAAVAELPLPPSMLSNPAVLAEEAVGQEAAGAAGECNLAEVQTGFCSSQSRKKRIQYKI